MDNKQYQQLADRFIEMWQDQLKSMISDKQVIDSMLAGLQQAFEYITPDDYEKPKPTSPKSQPADHAEPHLYERIGELEFRLRMAEQRIATLESERTPAKAAKPATRRRAKPGAAKAAKTAKISQ